MTKVYGAWIVVLLAAPASGACAWRDFDAVALAVSAPDGIAPDSDVLSADSSSGGSSSGADADGDGEATDGATISSAACSASAAPLQEWTFDAATQSWQSAEDPGVTADLTWTATVGQPTPGALTFAVIPGDGANRGAWIRYPASLGDLSGRTLSAWVLLDYGTSPHFKVFAQTGNNYAWGDNGTITLPSGQWTCVSLSFSAPSYNGPGYDPTDVVTIGFETLAVDAFRLFIDSVRIY